MLVFAHMSLEPKSGSADLAAELTRYSSARVWHSVLSCRSLIIQALQSASLKVLCALPYSCPPGQPVLGQGLPLVNWDVVGLEGRFQHIFVPLPLTPFVQFSS